MGRRRARHQGGSRLSRGDRREKIARGLVGRRRELDLVLAAVSAGRDVLLEGPPGTSKSTILRGVTAAWGVPFVLVEGNADLTPAKLLGHHNPARVLREDYSAANFVPGPLIQAMQAGGFLYIEELNRAPEDTLNALLAAMAEREVAVPRVGTVTATATFRVLASMNPYDNVGTARISASVYDRWCRLALGYQSAEEEAAIVAVRTGSADRRLIGDAVALTRATRIHPDLRRGSSVRGAIDLVGVAEALTAVRGPDLDGRGGYPARVLDAAHLALSARIAVDETVEVTPEAVITELWENHFILGPQRAKPGPHRMVVENAVQLPGAPAAMTLPRLKPLARKPKRLDEAPCLYQSGRAAPVVVELEGDDRRPGGAAPRELGGGVQGSIVTNELAQLRPLDELFEPSGADPEVARMAERIARRLSIRRSTRDHSGVRGSGRLESLPYRYGSDDIDLDRTIEVLTERPVPEDTDIIVRERVRTRRAVALLVDVSGSMRGEKIRTMAATVGALAGDLDSEDLALIAFWRDAALLKPLHTHRPGTGLLDDLLRIPARGLTNLHFALTVGLAELARSSARQRIAVLLSDSVHNAGPDPRLVALHYPRLHVLLQTDGEHDAGLAAELARLGHGLLAPVRDYRQVAPAVNRLLSA